MINVDKEINVYCFIIFFGFFNKKITWPSGRLAENGCKQLAFSTLFLFLTLWMHKLSKTTFENGAKLCFSIKNQTGQPLMSSVYQPSYSNPTVPQLSLYDLMLAINIEYMVQIRRQWTDFLRFNKLKSSTIY